MSGALDINAIMGRLPHRYPFLMIDRITSYSDTEAVALRNVTVNEPQFQGHFPDFPLMPGVMIAECVLQTSAFIGYTVSSPAKEEAKEDANAAANKRFVCVGMNVKFREMVRPGDQLTISAKLIKSLGPMSRVKGKVTSALGLVAEGDFSLATQDVNS